MNDAPASFISTMIEMDLTTILQALGDPVRLTIVQGLADGSTRACGSFGLGVAPSTASHHFKVLREAGVIETSISGAERLQTLRRDALDDAFPGLLDSVLGGASPEASRAATG
jgi:DNA-binding transcriptional ArsR family regulator